MNARTFCNSQRKNTNGHKCKDRNAREDMILFSIRNNFEHWLQLNSELCVFLSLPGKTFRSFIPSHQKYKWLNFAAELSL